MIAQFRLALTAGLQAKIDVRILQESINLN